MQKAVKNKEALIQSIERNRLQIKSFGVKGLGIFGSFVKNKKIQPDSDVDLLVEFTAGEKTFDNFMDLSFYLEDLLGRKVEIVTPQSLSKYIGPHILKEVEYVSL